MFTTKTSPVLVTLANQAFSLYRRAQRNSSEHALKVVHEEVRTLAAARGFTLTQVQDTLRRLLGY